MNFPEVKLPLNLSQEEAYEFVIAVFEEAELYVQRPTLIAKEVFEAAPYFTCPGDNEIVTVLVHVGPWSEAEIDLIQQYAETIKEMKSAWFDKIDVRIVSTHPLPPVLRPFAFPE